MKIEVSLVLFNPELAKLYGLKHCRCCNTWKTSEEFIKDRSRKDGLRTNCKKCYGLVHNKWQNANPGKRKISTRKYKYGLEHNTFLEMYEAQHGRCAICWQPLYEGGDGNGLHVDHDKITGKVRGLLHGWCNRGLGIYHEAPERLRAAAVYLENSRINYIN